MEKYEDDSFIKKESSIIDNENKMDELNISNISHHSIRSIQDNDITQNIKVFLLMCAVWANHLKLKKR